MPPLFLFVKKIEKVIRLCTVLKMFFLVLVLKIRPFFPFLNLVIWRALCAHYRSIDKFVKKTYLEQDEERRG